MNTLDNNYINSDFDIKKLLGGAKKQKNEDDDDDNDDEIEEDDDVFDLNENKNSDYEDNEEDIEDEDEDFEEDDDDDDVINNNIKKSNQEKIDDLQSNKLNSFISDDEEESDDDNDDDDEKYLQKFNENIKKNIISDYHPELQNHNYEEVEALCRIVRDENGLIIDPLHRTLPFLTKYEKARILGERSKQIESGAIPFVKFGDKVIDPYVIALKELEMKRIPFIIKRPLPNGGCEYWKLSDLEYL